MCVFLERGIPFRFASLVYWRASKVFLYISGYFTRLKQTKLRARHEFYAKVRVDCSFEINSIHLDSRLLVMLRFKIPKIWYLNVLFYCFLWDIPLIFFLGYPPPSQRKLWSSFVSSSWNMVPICWKTTGKFPRMNLPKPWRSVGAAFCLRGEAQKIAEAERKTYDKIIQTANSAVPVHGCVYTWSSVRTYVIMPAAVTTHTVHRCTDVRSD